MVISLRLRCFCSHWQETTVGTDIVLITSLLRASEGLGVLIECPIDPREQRADVFVIDSRTIPNSDTRRGRLVTFYIESNTLFA